MNYEKRRGSIVNRELLLAAGSGQEDKVLSCLADKANVNFSDADGNTALHWAADATSTPGTDRTGKRKVIGEILKNEEANLIVENKENKTALDLAWDAKDHEAVQIIGDAIRKKCKNLCKDLEKTSSEEQKKTVEPLKFYDATYAEDYECVLTANDIDDILDFFCLRFCADDLQGLEVLVKVSVQLAAQKEVILLYAKKKNEGPETYCSTTTTDVATSAKFCDFIITTDPKSDNKDQHIEGMIKALRICSSFESKVANMSKTKRGKNAGTVRSMCGEVTEEDLIDGRKLFANILYEKQRTVSKIDACLKLLQDVSNPTLDGFTTESARSANVAIFFFETFSLQDSRPLITMERNPLRTEEGGVDFEKIKKGLAKYYPKLKDKENTESGKTKPPSKSLSFLEVFQKVRGRVKRITCKDPNFLQVFLLENVDDRGLFNRMKSFTQTVSLNIKNRSRCGEQELFLNVQGKVGEDKMVKFDKVVTRFMKNLKPVKPNQQAIEMLCFDILASICPALEEDEKDKKPRIISNLRNNIIHRFERDPLLKWREELPLAIHDLYRFQLAQAVDLKFSELGVDTNEADLQRVLMEAITDVNGKYSENLEFLKEESGTRRTFVHYHGDISWMERNAEHFVGKYVQFMVPIFHSEDDDDDGGGDLDDDSNQLTYVSTIEKRELFEYFINVEPSIKTDCACELRFKIRKKIMKTLSFKKAQTITEHILHYKPDEQIERRLTEVLMRWNSLSLLPCPEGHLTPQDIAQLCSAYSNQPGLFRFGDHEGLLRHRKLDKSHTRQIEEKINEISISYPIKESIFNSGQVLTRMQFSDIILNLLKIFGDVHRAYRLKIEDVETAFQDEAFVDYLASRSVTYKNGQMDLRNISDTFKRIRGVRTLQCTAPYVARLLTKSQNFQVIEKDDLERIVNYCLLSESVYLDDLIVSKEKRVVEAFATGLVNRDLPVETIKNALRVPCRSGVLKDVVDCLLPKKQEWLQSHGNRSSIENLFTNILQVLNDLLLECIDEKKLEMSKDILTNTTKFLDGVKICFPSPNLEYQETKLLLHAAKLYNACGTQFCTEYNNASKAKESRGTPITDSCQGERLFTMAKEKLESVSKLDKYLYYLSLSRKAYSSYLLGRCHMRTSYFCKQNKDTLPEAKKALELQGQLYKEIWWYISGNPDFDPPKVYEYYLRAEASSLYKALKDSGPESRYIGVLKMKSTMAFYSWPSCKSSWDGLCEVLVQWNEIYVTKNQKIASGSDPYANNVSYDLLKRIGVYNELKKKASESERRYYAYKAEELVFLKYQKVDNWQSKHPSWRSLSREQEHHKLLLDTLEPDEKPASEVGQVGPSSSGASSRGRARSQVRGTENRRGPENWRSPTSTAEPLRSAYNQKIADQHTSNLRDPTPSPSRNPRK